MKFVFLALIICLATASPVISKDDLVAQSTLKTDRRQQNSKKNLVSTSPANAKKSQPKSRNDAQTSAKPISGQSSGGVNPLPATTDTRKEKSTEEIAEPPTSIKPELSQLKLEFNISEPLGLLRFLNGISKQSDEGQSYSDFLLLHHKLGKQDKELIRRYVRLQKSKAEFEIASGRKLSLKQQLMLVACNSKNFDDFFKSAKQYCDDNEYESLELILNHFRPIYEQVIWKPLSAQLNRDLAWFRENKQAFSRTLETVAKLFQSSAGNNSPLKATLVPVPTEVRKEGNGFHYISSAFSENLDLAIVLSIETVPPDTIAGFNDPRVNNKRTLEDNDGLIHEFVHMLWRFRSPELKKSLNAYFEKNGTQFNFDLLNEAQAAALQAWFYRQVTGKEKKGTWYDNNYVDKYAKALMPVLLECASNTQGKLNADEYAEKAIKAFEQTFPNWRADPQIILWRSQIVQAPLSVEDLADELNDSLFDFGGGEHLIRLVKGETWPNKFKDYANYPKMTTVFLIHPNQIDVLSKYFGIKDENLSELRSLLKENKDPETPVVKALKNGEQWLVFSVSNKQSMQKQGLLDYAKTSLKR